jgi:hypothetical protein
MHESSPRKLVEVPTGLYWQSRLFAATQNLWHGLGKLESKILADELINTRVDRPVYVTSLARAGTTIVTEMLAQHPQVTSLCYSDFPNMWTPYWRNWLLQRSRPLPPKSVERAHRDRIRVSNDSPEAVEEVLWRYFFPQQNETGADNVLNVSHRNPDFDEFYRNTILKLLLVRNAERYLAKGNYNISRIRYLLGLFPDAKFVVPVRHPVNHIASLVKQHRLFLEAHRQDQRVGRQLGFAGHWEFGPDRKFVHFGDAHLARQIGEAWDNGEDVKGWALYWAGTYEYLFSVAKETDSILIFNYETLCQQSESVIDRIIQHCQLDPDRFATVRADYAAGLTLPDYYQPSFNATELDTINQICAVVAGRLGYEL